MQQAGDLDSSQSTMIINGLTTGRDIHGVPIYGNTDDTTNHDFGTAATRQEELNKNLGPVLKDPTSNPPS
jgi:hypothetical protein